MLLSTKFKTLAENTVDYWMKPNSQVSLDDIENKIINLKWDNESNLQLYIHVPFCTQKCTFCAFSGGNSVQFEEAIKYVGLLIKQLESVFHKTGTKEKDIQSIHIGGGSPDLLNGEIGLLLDYLTNLPGYSKRTELSIEFSLFSVRDEFIDQLNKYPVSKASFGVQTLNPEIRRYLKMPTKLRKLDEICYEIRKNVPILNVDLMTGFPLQTLDDALSDLEYFINHPYVNSISSYLFSQGSAPAFVADVLSGKVPQTPTEEHHANLRLHSFATLLSHGWRRFGTNTYIDISNVDHKELSKIKGNECLGAHAYNDFLIGVGASAVSYFPGLRVENKSNLEEWISDVNKGKLPYELSKCSIEEQKDMTLWGVPLNYRGLHKDAFNTLVTEGIIDTEQIAAFNDYIEQGLIRLNANGVYNLTITGEVFQGHIVKGLKKKRDQSVISEYVSEGYELAKLASEGKVKIENALNNRQQLLINKLNKL
ncbi:TPA: radical SAM protein [Serratia liquefaciens]|nr:radical SAM protein [Serratia liquefaciens]